MNSNPRKESITSDVINDIEFDSIFSLEEVQRFQDLFSKASGLASIITDPDGKPITKPSNFCRLCNEIIRKTEKGLEYCLKSDAIIGSFNPSGVNVCRCLSGGLWNASAKITVNCVHIANWLIGEARNEELDLETILQFAEEIGANKEEYLEALNEVPVMSFEKFNDLAKILFEFAEELSERGCNNLELKKQIIERDNVIRLLQEKEETHLTIFDNAHEVFFQTDLAGIILDISPSIKHFTDFNKDELIGASVYTIYDDPEDREILLNAINKDGFLKDYELKLKTKTNAIRYAEISVHLFSGPDGKQNHIAGAIRDITKSKFAEEELHESEMKYRELVNNSPDAIVIYIDGEIVFVNNECIRLFGASGAQELVGKSVMDFVHPDSRAIVIERMGIAKKEKTVLPLIDEKFIRVDGSELDVEVKSMPIILKNKPAVQVIVRDITDRKKAEKDLVLLEKAIYTSGEAIFLTDREGVFTFVNPAFTALYGFSSDEIVGKVTPRIIKSGVYDRSVYDNFWLTLLNGDEVRGELINKKKDGTLIHVDESITPIFDEEKNSIGFLGIQRDITERKQAEERLKEQSDAMEAAVDGLAILHAEGKYTYMNKSHALIYGYENAGELIGKSWRVMYNSEELQRFEQEIFPELDQKGHYQGRALGLRKDGSMFHQALSLTTLENGGLICTVRDITDQKQAEQELINAKEKAEESDRLKTAFLNNISHEIRTPFNGILGFLSLILNDDLSNNEKREYGSFINQSAERLMNTINDLVEISQVQAGQIKLKVQQTNVIKMTEELFERFEEEVKKNGLEFFIYNNIPTNVVYINTDSTKLKIILSNLIGNAIKFTKKGSIVLNINLTGDFFEFCVKDSGTGIAKSKQPFIFERFNQVGSSVTRQFEGLGLGLSITKSYVEVLGGNIWLESEEGKGSCFYFTIPYSF